MENPDFRAVMDESFAAVEAELEGEAAPEAPEAPEAPVAAVEAVGDQGDLEAPEAPEGSADAEPEPSGEEPIAWGEGEKWRSSAELPEDFKVSFRRDGKDVSMSMDKLVSAAQEVQLLRRQERELRQERKDLRNAATERDDWKQKAESADVLLTEILRGDNALLQNMRQQYAKALRGEGVEPQAPAQQAQPQDADYQAGVKAVQEILLPHAKALGEAFDVEAEDILVEMASMIEEEGELSWEALEDIMNRRIITELEGMDYQAENIPTADLSKWKGKPSGERQRMRRRGGDSETERLQRQVDELKAQLQEKAVRGSPDVSKPGAAGKGSPGKRKASDAGAKSELLDLSGAKSFQEIQRELDKLEESSRRA